MDFQKAFDSCVHSKLLHKICNYDIHDALLRWVDSFLSSRTQNVVVGGHLSRPSPVISGVPQGSVLGPLLFLLFINYDYDIVEVIDNLNPSSCKLFADDIKIYSVIDGLSSNISLSIVLLKIVEWSSYRQLGINTAKCNVLHLGSANPRLNYSINGFGILSVDHSRDLGVMFYDLGVMFYDC